MATPLLKLTNNFALLNMENKNLKTIQYFSLQSSGFLTCLLTIDRFITLSSTPGSFYSKLPFSSPKSVATWSIGIITFFFLLNIHILFFYGYFEDPPSIYNQTILFMNR